MNFKRAASLIAVMFVAVMLHSGGAEAREWLLAENGVSRSVVILGEDATVIEKHAADELAYFLSKVTGAEIRVTETPVPGKYPVWLGTPDTNPAIGERGLLERVNTISGQGFLLYSDEQGLVIAGSAPLGAMFGAYALLEEYAGMRWFFPGEHGEYRPHRPSLGIGRIDDLQEPSFKRRTVVFSRVSGHQYTPDTWNWIARNRLQSQFHPRQLEEYEKRGALVRGGGHALSRMVPDELFDEHPEYFGLYDGERRRQSGQRGQPCTTHPEVISLAAEYLLEWFSENPGGRFTLNANDYPHFCQCDNCTALDPQEEIDRGYGGQMNPNHLSTRFFTFKDEVARRVWEVYPDVEIQTLAYHRYRKPPTAMVPDPRLWVNLCDHGRCFRHSLNDPDCEPNRWFNRMFTDWGKFDNPRGYFSYYNMIGGRPQEGIISVPMERIVSEEMRFMHGLGHKAWSLRVRPPDAQYPAVSDTPATRNEWRGNMQWYYLQAKLAWDIEQDMEELLDDLHDKFYGPASGEMRDYHVFIRELWENTPGHFMYGTPFEQLGRTVDSQGAVDKMRDMLRGAEAAAGENNIYAERVAVDRRMFEEGWVLAREKYTGTR